MRQYLLTVSMLCVSIIGLWAQQAVLSGVVTDERSGEQLVAAVISLEGNGKALQAVSDIDGRYSISGVDYGQYLLSVSFIGKQDYTQQLTIDQSEIELSVRLSDDQNVMENVVITDQNEQSIALQRLNAVEGAAIYASKKTELIVLDQLSVNKANNLSRQIYAQVAGLNIWESDGAGVQLGIGGRGLSPSRNSNFNTRQNGYDISADALGYPESYYTPSAEAIDRIEVVRGAASLQYGTQFGGMINFKLKEGSTTEKLDIKSRQSVGSYGFFNSFNSIGGTAKKLKYYGYYQYKRSDGWRPNSSLEQHTGYLSLGYQLGAFSDVKLEYTHTNYLAQQPGGLTDTQFEMDPRQSNRERNWFAVDWNLFALSWNIKLSESLRWNHRAFGLIAGRDALGNLDPINLLDFGENRDFLSDDFQNWGQESRVLWRYGDTSLPSTMLVGARYYRGLTDRRQGDGDDGTGPNFEYLNPDNLEGSDFELPSRNFALFAENVYNISPQWSVTPGIRYEYISTATDGYYRTITRDLAGNILQDERIEEQRENNRSFVFLGVGASYKPTESKEWYINFSQNYRAINFNDIRVNVGSLVVDPDLKDERGFNLDVGFRGSVNRWLRFDQSVYFLSYQDRIGTVLRTEPNPAFNGLVDRIVRYRSNIADARIYGLESVAELSLSQLMGFWTGDDYLNLFTNFSYTHARYESEINPLVDGKDVELVPPYIIKTGVRTAYGPWSGSLQYSFTKEHFSDASNAIRTPSAIEGIIPSYQIVDFAISYAQDWWTLEANVNNLLDEAYFTRRATGYPGPGIIPSVGRTFTLTLGVDL